VLQRRLAGVDVLHIAGAVALAVVDEAGAQRRRPPRANGYRLTARHAGIVGQTLAAPVERYEVDPEPRPQVPVPPPPADRMVGDQEFCLAERLRVLKQLAVLAISIDDFCRSRKGKVTVPDGLRR